MSKVLVATAKNEGPFIWEWVAHHLSIGFDSLIIFQNDSDDFTHEILKELQSAGLVKYKYNHAKPGSHQVKAYKRAARQDEYITADWAMALDLDEFLFIKTGHGTIDCLLSQTPDADKILINWRRFGNSGQISMSPELVTKRFTLAEDSEMIKSHVQPFKALYRRASFTRAGIHQPQGPTKDELVVYNGSGLRHPQFQIKNFQCSDPLGRALAQVNHYIVKDPQAFALKNTKGSAHQTHRIIGQDYWKRRNRNHELDVTAQRYERRLADKMLEIDQATGGRLSELTAQAYRAHELAFARAVQDDATMDLYRYCLKTSVVADEKLAPTRTEPSEVRQAV